MEDSHNQPISLGSGFFLFPDIVVTNLHVVEGASGGYAKLVGQDRHYSVSGVVSLDAEHDLVFLKVDGANAPVLRLADDDQAGIGDVVYVLGNPLGLEGTFSQGILSGIRHSGDFELFQITAPISPGSSGGPVLTAIGEVMGVAVATLKDGQNINFAIPTKYIKALLADRPLTKDVAPLSRATAARTAKNINADLEQPSLNGVVAVNVRWASGEKEYTGYPSSYTFTIRNKLSVAVKNVYYVVSFIGADEEPVQSVIGTLADVILPGLAKMLDSTPSYGNRAPYPGHAVRKQTKRIEVRILDFEVVR